MKKRIEIDRRKFLIGTAALASASIAAPAVLRAADKELRILTWEGYAEPEWLGKYRLFRLGG
jgi:putative spermidine/putrescine transport system substrate-binding protein